LFWGPGAKPLVGLKGRSAREADAQYGKYNMAQELKVIQDFYDFMLWLIAHTEK